MVFGLGGGDKKKQIRVEIDGEVRTAGLVEGAGIYRCNTHDYETENINEFNKHNLGEGHPGNFGNGACGFCGNNVIYKGKKPSDKLICEKCSEDLKKQFDRSKEEA